MSGETLAEHERWMRAALAIGRRSMGRAAPNPSVGALVVKDGAVLGRGVTAPGGRPHAEPPAIAQAGAKARGATLYVTLEPCNHVGRTPPCVDAIIQAGIATVVFALLDPDSRVAGRGLERLRDAGITVVGPVLEAAAGRDHRGHVLRVTRGRPAVSVKMAETADGFGAAAPGEDRLLITGATANARVHMERALHDAVLVGHGTAAADDPLLTVRLPGLQSRPARIILDSDLQLPERSKLVRAIADSPLIIAVDENVDPARASRFETLGATVMRVVRGLHGLDLGAVLAALGRMGLTRIFCEGGPRLASALIGGGWADEVMLISSQMQLDTEGLPALNPDARRWIADPAAYALREDIVLGTDRLRRFERIEIPCSPDL